MMTMVAAILPTATPVDLMRRDDALALALLSGAPDEFWLTAHADVPMECVWHGATGCLALWARRRGWADDDWASRLNLAAACDLAARRGHTAMLQLLHERGVPWYRSTFQAAAFGGHRACLAYLHAQGCPWDKKTAAWAARGGRLDCLRFLRERGCPWDQLCCLRAAVAGGHEETRAWIEDQKEDVEDAEDDD